MNITETVTAMVLDTVKKDYAGDIALVLSHTTLNIDREAKAVSYFVPVTDRGRSFARTFLYKGVGIDLWAVEWERLEAFAALEEYNITCLADAEILWAASPEAEARFLSLRQTQKANLADPVLMRQKALRAYAEARQICAELVFADAAGVRMGAGYVLDYLAQAIAFTNCRYFRHSQMEQPEELAGMPDVPDGFTALYRRILTGTAEEQKKLCADAVMLVQAFLENRHPEEEKNVPDFQILAGWYAELAYTWLRIRTYAAQGALTQTYMWGALLQLELNTVCGEFSLPPMDLMGCFDAGNLPAFAARADALEKEIRAVLTAGGAVIPEYDTPEMLAEALRHEI